MKIPVVDPFGAVQDPKMPFLARALDPDQARQHLARCFAERSAKHATKEVLLRLCAIRITRWKPERRCLIEYDVEVEAPGASVQSLTLIGKVRAKGLDKTTYAVQTSLWRGAFGVRCEDDICVPEPVGTILEFHMWLQAKEPGVAATELLLKPDGAALARRIAEAACKLHQANVSASRRHTMADELRILHERLALVAQAKPAWDERLRRLLAACDRLGATVPEPAPRGIHRDFYPAQVIVNGPRLCLVDFDLYCQGDPALDIGNFLGHLTEQSLRTFHDAGALADRENALAERFVELAGEATRAAVRAYATLTLARHIHISTLFPERRPFTSRLLELCEERLADA